MSEATVTAANPTEPTPAPAVEVTPAPAVVASTPEQKPTSESTPAAKTTLLDEPKPAEVKAETVAPDKYEFKAPEGSEFDPGVIEAFSTVAKELKLTQEAAQQVVDKVVPAMQSRQAAQVDAIQTEWKSASQIDKEFGGDKLAENLAVAKKALDSFATPALRTMLTDTGLGNHPEVIRMLFKVGKAISEDSIVVGGAHPSGKKPEDVFFPTMTKA